MRQGLSEADTRAKLIDPALHWSVGQFGASAQMPKETKGRLFAA